MKITKEIKDALEDIIIGTDYQDLESLVSYSDSDRLADAFICDLIDAIIESVDFEEILDDIIEAIARACDEPGNKAIILKLLYGSYDNYGCLKNIMQEQLLSNSKALNDAFNFIKKSNFRRNNDALCHADDSVKQFMEEIGFSGRH